MPEFNKETLMNSLIKQLEDVLNSVCSAEAILRRDSDFRKVMDIINPVLITPFIQQGKYPNLKNTE